MVFQSQRSLIDKQVKRNVMTAKKSVPAHRTVLQNIEITSRLYTIKISVIAKFKTENPFHKIFETKFLIRENNVLSAPLVDNFPHKAWVDPGEGLFTYQVNCREWGLNCNRLCSNQSPWQLYQLTQRLVNVYVRGRCQKIFFQDSGFGPLRGGGGFVKSVKK